MRRCWSACLVLAVLSGAGCAARSPEVFGRSVTLVPTDERAPKTTGELLAVDVRGLWVRTKDGVRAIDPASLRQVRVRRHGLTGSWARRFGILGGFASGVALTASCASVEGNDVGGCASVGLVSAALWSAVGLLAAPGLESSSRLELPAESLARLRPYARFPAGLPKDVAPQSLVAGPPGPR